MASINFLIHLAAGMALCAVAYIHLKKLAERDFLRALFCAHLRPRVVLLSAPELVQKISSATGIPAQISAELSPAPQLIRLAAIGKALSTLAVQKLSLEAGPHLRLFVTHKGHSESWTSQLQEELRMSISIETFPGGNRETA